MLDIANNFHLFKGKQELIKSLVIFLPLTSLANIWDVFITLFVTYKRTKEARVLHLTRVEKLGSDKHSSLFGLFVSCEENEVL